jgi:hypothetical protein
MTRCSSCSYWFREHCSCPSRGTFVDGTMKVFDPRPLDPEKCVFYTTSKNLPVELTLEQLEGGKP